MKIVVTKLDNERRGVVTRSIEFERNVNLSDAIGVLDGLLRQCFPKEMRNKNINLSRSNASRTNEDVPNVAPQSPMNNLARRFFQINEDSIPLTRTENAAHSDVGHSNGFVNAGSGWNEAMPPPQSFYRTRFEQPTVSAETSSSSDTISLSSPEF